MLVAAIGMLETTLDEVEDALHDMDFESIKNSAGRVENVAMEIGANDLAASANSLKRMASIQDVDGARARLIELRSEKDRLERLSV